MYLQELIFYSLGAIAFGFFQKIADGHDEHGLDWFPGADIVFGITWGVIWFLLIFRAPVVANAYMSLVLYWLYKKKIDYLNHIISIGIIFIGFLFIWRWLSIIPMLLMLGGYILLDLVKRNTRNIPYLHPFFYYRLHFVGIPLLYTCYLHDLLGLVVILNIAGVLLAKHLFHIR